VAWVGNAGSVLALGDAVSALPAPGAAVASLGVGSESEAVAESSTGLFAGGVSIVEAVEEGSLAGGVAGFATALLLDFAFEDFAAFGFFGTLGGSVLVASDDDAVAAGPGAALECESASATAVDGACATVTALASLAGAGDEARDALALTTVFGATATPDASMWWLYANAAASTMAMIMPKAIGKCFTGASCRDGQSPSDTGGVFGLRGGTHNRTATTRRFDNSDTSSGMRRQP
jgi:hypothetical protein